jgi:hypothetical protein
VTTIGTDPRIKTTKHALDRVRSRHGGEFATLSVPECHRQINREVGAAIRAGRVARTQPRWSLSNGRDHRSKGHGGKRWCWNAAMTRAYMIQRITDMDGGGPSILVITCLARGAE